jgi:hypothetical protein
VLLSKFPKFAKFELEICLTQEFELAILADHKVYKVRVCKMSVLGPRNHSTVYQNVVFIKRKCITPLSTHKIPD